MSETVTEADLLHRTTRDCTSELLDVDGEVEIGIGRRRLKVGLA